MEGCEVPRGTNSPLYLFFLCSEKSPVCALMSLGVSWGHTSGEACVRRIIFSELSNSSSSHEATLGHARSFLRNRNKQSLSLSCPPSWLSYSTLFDVCSGWMRPWTFFCSILALWSQGPEPLWILTVSSCHHLFVSDWIFFFFFLKCDSPRGETAGFTQCKTWWRST